MIGRRLSRYEIVGKLGEGGMGEVYEARDLELERLIALKLLPADLAADPERLERFRREARALAAFNHPHIVTIHSVESADGLHFLTMERVEGRSLDRLIPAEGLGLGALLDLAVPLTEALAAAHERGIIHRDLKPANVMVTDTGQLKVLDFGLAKLQLGAGAGGSELKTLETMAAMTGEGALLGTVPYMSPEQAQGQPIDPRSDIFSLGIVLYEMATGRHPFGGETSLSVLTAIVGQSPERIARQRRGLPRRLRRLIHRCLAKDPEERPQTVAEVRDRLVELRRRGAVGGDLPARGPLAILLGRRARPWMLGALGALAIVAILWWLPLRIAPSLAPEPVPRFTLTQLTDLPGHEGEPVLAPDGSRFLYVGDAAGNLDIYVQRVGGERAFNLTADHEGDDQQPAFSRDGSRIAFRSERAGGGLYVMGATGESPVRVVDGGFHPAWTPDGGALLYSTTLTRPRYRGETTGLWMVALDSGETRRLLEPDVAQPQISPRGLRVAFWAMDGGLWTAPAFAEPRRALFDEGRNDWGPVWSGDGEYLYFVSDRGGQYNVWRVAVDEETGEARGPAQAVTAGSERAGRPSLSDDGRRLAYEVSTASGEIFEVGFDPASETLVGAPRSVLRSTKPFLNAGVSPDGSRIAYSSTEPREDLFSIRRDGSGRIQLTADDFLDRGARWSPDGSRLVFYSTRTSTDGTPRSSIWTVRPEGGAPELLLDDRAMTIMAPVWSADGRSLAVVDKLSGVFRLLRLDLERLGESDPVERLELLAEGEIFAPVAWSPDGRYLSGYGVEEGIVPLKVYDLRTGAFATAVDASGSVVQAAGSAFLSDSRRLLYCGWTDGALGIWDLGGSEVREIPGLRAGVECKISLTADQKTLVGSRIFDETDVWLLEFDEAGKGR